MFSRHSASSDSLAMWSPYHLAMELSDEQLEDWHSSGWLTIKSVFDNAEMTDMSRWVDEVASWSGSNGPGLHHRELTKRGPVLARSEHFLEDHASLRAVILGRAISEVLEQLFDEPAVLFKEKINYKHPGGAGFAYHQDATAYRFVDHHISCMVPIDPSTVESGTLYFAPGHTMRLMPTTDGGRIESTFAETLDWRPIEARPGDVIFFDSYAPHYSGSNNSDRSRRAMYLTYNAASKGDHRSRYYADKLAEFEAAGKSFSGERVRISINDDFLGIPVRDLDPR